MDVGRRARGNQQSQRRCGEFRKALGAFPTGVVVAATRGSDGLLQGMTVSCLIPCRLILRSCCSPSAATCRQTATAWGISVLGEAQHDVSTRFAQSGCSKWSGLDPANGVTGVPLVPGALAHFECERHALHDGGDHVILVGRVVALRRPSVESARPLVFFSGRYHHLHAASASGHGKAGPS